MASLLTEVQFWTFKDLLIKDVYSGVSKLYDKGEGDAFLENPYLEDHKTWSEDRDIVCIPRNKRPEKLKDTLKELEELLETHKCTTLKWIDAAVIQLFFSSGILVTIFLSENCNIKRVQIDRHLVGKLVSDHIVEVIIEDSHLLVSYVEPKLSYIYFGKQQSSSPARKYEKLAAMDPKIVTFDLIGPTNRHIERRLSSNSLHDAVLVWWHTDTQEAWPWSPLTSDRDRANILVYALNGPSLELMCFSHIDKNLLHATFRQHQSNHILTVEEETRKSKEVVINVCTYEVSRTRFHQISVTSIPLEEHVLSAQWSPAEDKLLLSCSDRSLVIYDAYRHLTRITTLNFAVQQISWHPSGTLALVASELGQLQCFDAALCCIKLELVGEEAESTKILEMSNFFRQRSNLTFIAWQSCGGVELSKQTKSAISTVVALFERGPLTIIKFPLGVLNVGKLTSFELITQYLKCKQVDEAVCLLLSLDWNRQGELCLRCLSCIINWLLRKPLNQDREVQLEAALGSFYGPNEPLPEVVILEYRDQVGHLARRFFHHLLRYQRFEKAFLLAVDLDCQDLFLDLHYVAEMKGEMALAEVALQHADHLDVASVLTGSDTGESVSCDDETTEFSDCSSSDCQDDRNNNQHSTLEVIQAHSKNPCHSPPQSSYIGSSIQATPSELCSPVSTTQRNPGLFVSPQALPHQDLQAPTSTAQESLESSTSTRNFTKHTKQSLTMENKNHGTSVPTVPAGSGLFSPTRTLTQQATQPPVSRAPVGSGLFSTTRTLTQQASQSPVSRAPADSGPLTEQALQSPVSRAPADSGPLTEQALQSPISRAPADSGPFSPTKTLIQQASQSSVSRAPADSEPLSPTRTKQVQQSLVYTASTGSDIFSPVKNLAQQFSTSSVPTGLEPFVPVRTVMQYPVQFKNAVTYKPTGITEHPQLPLTVNPTQIRLASSVTTKTVLPQTHHLLASSLIEHSGNNKSFGLHQTTISGQVGCSNVPVHTEALTSLQQPRPYINSRSTQVLLQPPHPTISHNVANSSWIGFQNNMNVRQGQPSHGHFNRTPVQGETRSQPLYRGTATGQILMRSPWTPSPQHYLTPGGQHSFGAYQWPQCYSSGFTPARSVSVGPSGHYPQSFYHPVWQDRQPLVHTGQNCGAFEGLSKLGNQQSHLPGYSYTSDPNEHFVDSDEIQAKQNSDENTLDKTVQEDEQEHSEEEDLEGARVKFVHFGVV